MQLWSRGGARWANAGERAKQTPQGVRPLQLAGLMLRAYARGLSASVKPTEIRA